MKTNLLSKIALTLAAGAVPLSAWAQTATDPNATAVPDATGGAGNAGGVSPNAPGTAASGTGAVTSDQKIGIVQPTVTSPGDETGNGPSFSSPKATANPTATPASETSGNAGTNPRPNPAPASE